MRCNKCQFLKRQDHPVLGYEECKKGHWKEGSGKEFFPAGFKYSQVNNDPWKDCQDFKPMEEK